MLNWNFCAKKCDSYRVFDGSTSYFSFGTDVELLTLYSSILQISSMYSLILLIPFLFIFVNKTKISSRSFFRSDNFCGISPSKIKSHGIVLNNVHNFLMCADFKF